MIHPCFKNNKERIVFIIILLLVLFAPFVTYFMDRQVAYRSVSAKCGPYYHMKNEIFNKKEDIDMLFLSSSEMWTALDIKHLRELWKTKYNRDFNIIMLGSNWRGMDRFFFLLKDFFKSRKAKLIVMSIYGRGCFPYYGSKHLFNVFEHQSDFRNFPKLGLTFYAHSILGVPRLVYEHFKNVSVPNEFIHNSVLCRNYGSLMEDLGFHSPIPGDKEQPFKKRFDVPPTFKSSEVVFRGQESKLFSAPQPLDEFEYYCYNLIVDLCKRNGAKLVLLQVPLPQRDNKDKVILDQPLYHTDVPIVGMNLSMLFPGMDMDNIKFFYKNSSHPNSNGARYFTESLSEVFYELYTQ